MKIQRWLAILAMMSMLTVPAFAAAQEGTQPTGSPEASIAGPWPQIDRHVVYGENDPGRQYFHVYRLEPRDAPRPGILLIHGGAFVSDSPDSIPAKAPEAFTSQGIVVFNVGYRLFNETTGENAWPAQIDDVQRAVRYIRAHAAEFNVDPDRLCALGWSAGGTLAALLGTMETRSNGDTVLAAYSSRVACVVDISGPSDFTTFSDDPGWHQFFANLFHGTLTDAPELWQAASPVYQIDEDTVPFLIAHGAVDDTVPVEQSRRLASALQEQAIEVVYAEFPDAGHMDLIFSREEPHALAVAFVYWQLHPEQ